MGADSPALHIPNPAAGVTWSVALDGKKIILRVGKVTHVMGCDCAKTISAALRQAAQEGIRRQVLESGDIVGRL